jgi:hypothetical protein
MIFENGVSNMNEKDGIKLLIPNCPVFPALGAKTEHF